MWDAYPFSCDGQVEFPFCSIPLHSSADPGAVGPGAVRGHGAPQGPNNRKSNMAVSTGRSPLWAQVCRMWGVGEFLSAQGPTMTGDGIAMKRGRVQGLLRGVVEI